MTFETRIKLQTSSVTAAKIKAAYDTPKTFQERKLVDLDPELT